jgi:hypothetical protein
VVVFQHTHSHHMCMPLLTCFCVHRYCFQPRYRRSLPRRDRASQMPRPPRVRRTTLPRVVASHRLARADPILAQMLGVSVSDHVVVSVRSTYATAAASYERFCERKDLPPWPTDGIQVAAWLLDLVDTVKPSSMQMYLAGLQYHQALHDLPWTLLGNEVIRRTLRYLKRCFPSAGGVEKTTVSVGVLKATLPLLPGWPCLEAMSHDDRAFAAASVIAVCGYLRGGEFLRAPGSKRPVLLNGDVCTRSVGESTAVVLTIRQAKATWWLEKSDVFCFASGAEGDPAFCPVRLRINYQRLAPAKVKVFDAKAPAFCTSDGRALTKRWMVQRTEKLLAKAGIVVVNAAGRPTKVRAASWRAGAVRSAIDAGVPVPFIQACGRWKSAAWIAYLVQSSFDLQGAAQRSWARPALRRGAEVEKCDPAVVHEDDMLSEVFASGLTI